MDKTHDYKVAEIARTIDAYFKSLRFNPSHHLGLGDIRLTVSQQEEITELIKRMESHTNIKVEGTFWSDTARLIDEYRKEGNPERAEGLVDSRIIYNRYL